MNTQKKNRVLLLDDDQFMLEYVSELLRELGVHKIWVAQDGATGLAVIKDMKRDIDLLICDIEMPGMDGIEFLRNIAVQGYSGNIVLFSGLDRQLLKAAERFAKASGLCVTGTLSKPVTLNALTAILMEIPQRQPAVKVKRSEDNALVSVKEVKNALSNDDFCVFYQPKVAIRNSRITGFECLARWPHKKRGFISPDKFIPVVEEYDLIDQFTLMIFRKSVQQLAQWLNMGFDLKAAVNLSMENLNRHDLPEVFEEVTRAAHVPANKIILEITESKIGKDIALCLDILTRFRLKGFGLAIDDFGTGYASMETLNNLPFTELKIDRTFVNAAVSDSSSRAIVESSVNLGKEFGLNIVAEGVENQAEWDLVAKLGCTEVQGYFISKPLPHDEFSQLNGLST